MHVSKGWRDVVEEEKEARGQLRLGEWGEEGGGVPPGR